ncbi:MAG TPA: DUF4249 domain-containing protein [Bacteroidales bacterium]|nr:DUF4249 domain-containing protein [Bacteroidales bacterium]HRZ48396.1 DUF4249 domain-containing protein [Bacteroidales bacterium]
MGILSSCREKIELELDSTYTRLVVEGSITDRAIPHTVTLTATSDYLTTAPPPAVTGALVEITDGMQIFPLTETAPGVYQTDPSVKGIPGKEYTLTIRGVDINGDGKDEIYSASEVMKPAWVIDSVVTQKQNPATNPPLYKVNGWGKEPSTTGDCYIWNLWVNGKLQSDTLYKSVFIDDTYVNGSYLPGLTIFDDIKAGTGDTIVVETRALTRRYYDFLVTLMLEAVWNQGGGAGPPANVKGNINNGALGYFHASGVSYNTAVVK